MKFVILLLLTNLIYSQDHSDCVKNSIIKENYYIEGKKIVKGISHGDVNFIIHDCYLLDNSIILKVNIKENENIYSIEGVNCNKVYKTENGFLIKKNIFSSTKDGIIYISKNLKLKYILLSFPGVMPIIIDYKKLYECLSNVTR